MAAEGLALLEKVNAFFSGVNPVIDPLTYSHFLTMDWVRYTNYICRKTCFRCWWRKCQSRANESMPSSNEAIAKSLMHTLANAEMAFKSTKGNNGYGTVEQLVSAGLLSKEMLDKYGYRIEVSVLTGEV